MDSDYFIAVVDDHTMFRKGLCALIKMFPNCKVLFDAQNGKDFIQQIKLPHAPEIVLLDIVMPEMDGYETADWIRANLPNTKILALSTMDSEHVILRMIKHGARGYILKDAEPAELKLAFKEVMTQGYYYNDLISRKVLKSVATVVDERSEISTLVKLTQRELEFIKFACSEKTYEQIAKEMYLSERTIDGYRETLFKKLNVGTRVGLVIYAIKNNLVKL